MVLTQENEPLTELLSTMRTTLLLSFLLLMVLLAGLARISIRAGLKPLRHIAREVEHIGVENLHELRTPIAELRALAEVGKEWPSERDMVEGFFGNLVDLAEDMERTVGNLLMLARLDAGTQDIKKEAFDLALLVDGIVGKFAGQIEEKALRFRNEVPAGVAVMTDKDKLKLILINIICNAITYSPGGSEIAIQATQINPHVELNVSNDTVDLDENDVSMMFERFWRKEQVRTGGNHAGLGLSLVKALAELLNLKVKPMLDAGSRFALTLSGLDHAV